MICIPPQKHCHGDLTLTLLYCYLTPYFQWQELLQAVIQVLTDTTPLRFLFCASQNSPPRGQLSERRKQHRTDLAKVTFDLYKNNPRDFIGCLNVKATLYGVYSVSYDLRCYAAKRMLK